MRLSALSMLATVNARVVILLSMIKGVFPEIGAGLSRHVVFMVGDADIEGALDDLLWVCSLAIRPYCSHCRDFSGYIHDLVRYTGAPPRSLLQFCKGRSIQGRVLTLTRHLSVSLRTLLQECG